MIVYDKVNHDICCDVIFVSSSIRWVSYTIELYTEIHTETRTPSSHWLCRYSEDQVRRLQSRDIKDCEKINVIQNDPGLAYFGPT